MKRWPVLLCLSLLCLRAWGLDDPVVIRPQKFSAPMRDLSVIYTAEGFYPEKFSIYAGEKVRIFLTATTENPGCLLMPEKEVFLSAEKGKLAEIQVLFKEAGVHKFYCPKGKVFGQLTVLERPEVVKARERSRLRREIASQKTKVKLWRPREE